MNQPTGPALLLALLCASDVAIAGDLLIPRTNPDDVGKYYLLEKTKTGNIIQALSKRVDKDGSGYTLTETDCATMRMRVIGYSDTSRRAIRKRPTEWFALEPGTSKSDLANFVCEQAPPAAQ